MPLSCQRTRHDAETGSPEGSVRHAPARCVARVPFRAARCVIRYAAGRWIHCSRKLDEVRRLLLQATPSRRERGGIGRRAGFRFQ